MVITAPVKAASSSAVFWNRTSDEVTSALAVTANSGKVPIDSFVSSRAEQNEERTLSDQLRKLSYSNSRHSAPLRPATNKLQDHSGTGRFIPTKRVQLAGGPGLRTGTAKNSFVFGNPGESKHRPPSQIERDKVVDWLVSQLPENRKKKGEEPISLDWAGKDGKWACVDVYLNGVDQSGVNPGPLMSTLDGTRDVKNLTLTMQKANNGRTKYYRDWNNGTEKQFLRPGQFLILDGEEDYAHSVVVHKVRDVRRGGGCDGPRYDKVIDVIGLSQGKDGPQFSIIEDYESYLSEGGFTIRGFGDLPINE